MTDMAHGDSSELTKSEKEIKNIVTENEYALQVYAKRNQTASYIAISLLKYFDMWDEDGEYDTSCS